LIYDVSRTLSPACAVFPGDTAFSARQVMRLSDGDACDVSTVELSVHTGTHVDAPSHFLPGAPTIDTVDLEQFIGPARVVEVATRAGITVDELARLPIDGATRVLFKTGSAPDPGVFNLDFAYLTATAATALVERGVRLVGIDTPSMDHAESKTLDAHRALLTGGVAILENLWLEDVEPGDYELIALPLKLAGLDASPVRAVLRR
jgi:arylformamidase